MTYGKIVAIESFEDGIDHGYKITTTLHVFLFLIDKHKGDCCKDICGCAFYGDMSKPLLSQLDYLPPLVGKELLTLSIKPPSQAEYHSDYFAFLKLETGEGDFYMVFYNLHMDAYIHECKVVVDQHVIIEELI